MLPWRERLNVGQVIPACPLMLEADGTWSERFQRAIIRYYIAAGAGGLAVGVHGTQFAIRDPQHGLFEPLLRLASTTIDAHPDTESFIKIAGICGQTDQARAEAQLAVDCGYHAGLLSLTAWGDADESTLLEHCRAIGKEIPLIGFYLQPAVGGRVLSYSFWRRLAEVESLIAIKIAPFNRYQTCDVVRAVIDGNRPDVALYTGNDDNIILDLLTPFQHEDCTRFIVGGLLGQWGVWTHRAVEMLEQIRDLRKQDTIPTEWLSRNIDLTDANGAIFDVANRFRGCLPGILEVLRRQGLAPTNRCLDPDEVLSPGQADELDRVHSAYPDLHDDDFVREGLPRWLDG